ncbi:MAG: hypothetical protein GY896_02375 [Gammaproteobacteria bacterium]|nr:hypothetical protein [Gammaproteobacteria bacterium]
MIRLQINPAFNDLLQAHKLGSYPQIMHTTLGETIEENELRDVHRLDLNGQNFYLKRTRSEKASSALESYSRLRLAHSKPYKEMLQFRYLAQLSFNVAEVVGCGEELHWGIPLKGFIITREVPGEDLALVYRGADEDRRRSIMTGFGSLLGRLHDRGFFGSTRLKDIFIDGDPLDSPLLTLIDRETRNPYPKPASAKRILSRLMFNIRRQTQQGEIFSTNEWRAFSESYCRSLSSHLEFEAESLLRGILLLVGPVNTI